MVKKIYNILFIVIFMAIITLPLIKANWTSGGISEDENRYLAEAPKLITDGWFNDKFTAEVETWFMDHMGYRKHMIGINALMHYTLFDRIQDGTDYHLGQNGELNYATDEMILDYAHLNLRNDEEIEKIGKSYQIVSDWLKEQEIQFYYMQCWDKHSIYPEQFMTSVNQIGDVSKTDQIITYLRDKTTVNVISFKEVLLDSKNKYEVYSNWGDPSHWSPRGAVVGYKYMMDIINKDNNNVYKVLSDDDYNINIVDQGTTLNNVIHEKDMLEQFVIKEKHSKRVETFEDTRCGIWINENVDNRETLLLMCDSYFGDYIVPEIAESFYKVVLIWADYGEHMPYYVKTYQPDMVIFECAERADRSHMIETVANKIIGTR